MKASHLLHGLAALTLLVAMACSSSSPPSGNGGGSGGGTGGGTAGGAAGGTAGGAAGGTAGGSGGGTAGGAGGGTAGGSGGGTPTIPPIAVGRNAVGVTVSPNGQFAYAVNSEGTISEFSASASTGLLTPLATGATGVCVTFQGSDPGNCIATGGNPLAPLTISADGKFAYVPNRNDSTLSLYTIASSGVLAPLNTGVTGICQSNGDPGNCIATGQGPNSVTLSSSGTFAYVGNSDNTISEFSVNTTTGILSPLNTGATGICTTGGANTNCIATGSSVTQNVSPRVALSADGRFAYLANSGDNTVSEYTVNATTGALAPLATGATGICKTTGTDPGNCIAAGAMPAAVAVNGRYVYVANSSEGTVSEYTINATTGALAPLATGVTGMCVTFTGSDPGNCMVTNGYAMAIALSSNGQFAYVVNGGSAASVSEYSISSSTGALVVLPDAANSVCGETINSMNPKNCVYTGGDSTSIAVSPNGKFAYVTNSLQGAMTGYSINTTTGSITPITE